jgi:hypothetical protein
LLGDTNQAESRRTRTKAAKKEITKTSNWYKEKETATFIVNEDLLEKMKSLAIGIEVF